MPGPQEITDGLRVIANEWQWLAVVLHGYFALVAAALLSGARSRRLAGPLLALPLFAVSVLAWVHGNPFNGSMFGVTAVALSVIAGLSPGTIRRASPVPVLTGLGLFGFGWVYPHFLETGSAWAYLYASPLGLVPCPTLAAVAGLTLALGGLGSVAWSGVLAAMAIFYGALGALYLGVGLDWVLLGGGLVLGVHAIRMARASGVRQSDR